MSAFAACPIAALRRKISDASLPASPPNSATTSSLAVGALFNLGPRSHSKIGEYAAMGFPGAPALLHVVTPTKALYYKSFADQFVYSLPPGFDPCAHHR